MPDLDEITAGEQPFPSGSWENNESGQDCLGLDKSRVRLHTAIARAHRALVMAAQAVCAVTAASPQPHRHTAAPPAGQASPARRPVADPAHRPGTGPPTCPIQPRALAQATASPPGPLSPVQLAHQLARCAELTLVS